MKKRNFWGVMRAQQQGAVWCHALPDDFFLMRWGGQHVHGQPSGQGLLQGGHEPVQQFPRFLQTRVSQLVDLVLDD
jgi:hypothetical protein